MSQAEGQLLRTPEDVIEQLGAVQWGFDDSTTRDLTHDMHPWPAKFIPDIPATVIRLLTSPGDCVLDPFSGCGTTAVEALRADRSTIAIDINPLAALITEAKTTIVPGPTRQRIADWLKTLTALPSDAKPRWLPPAPNLDYWFDLPVAAELAELSDAIADFGHAHSFLRVALSSIIVSVSHQESETRYRRVEREVTPTDVLGRFNRRVTAGLEMLADLEHAAAETTSTVRSICADARNFIDDVPDAKAELAMFSPPYPNAFDYHLYHRFRMFWLGMDPRPVKHSEIGAHLKYEPGESWETDMTAVIEQVAAVVRPGGYVVCVVGDGIIKGEAFPSGDRLWAIASSCGLSPVWRTEREVSRSRRSFNLSDSRLRQEHVLAFAR